VRRGSLRFETVVAILEVSTSTAGRALAIAFVDRMAEWTAKIKQTANKSFVFICLE
jgi:hypothetical protein